MGYNRLRFDRQKLLAGRYVAPLQLVELRMSKKSTSKAISRRSLFGPPPVLAGEDAAAYDELLGLVCAAVKPVDVIDEMFIADVVSSEWEVLRWRRLKWSLIRAAGLKALADFLGEKLDYYLYEERFVDHLTQILQENLAEDQAEDFAPTLAQQCANHEPDAVDKVNEVLTRIDLNMDNVLNRARADKVEALANGYERREPEAVKLINELLAEARVSIDSLVAEALAKELDFIERVDRLTTIAESRRNASLREIDRRRQVLRETPRPTAHKVEDGEFQVIETTPAEGKDAA
jgi:hypothetical protein